MISFFKKKLFEQISQSLKILVLYCFKVCRCMNKTHLKTHEKRQGRENKILKNFAKSSNNQRMPHRTSSTRNDHEGKINYDQPKNCMVEYFPNKSCRCIIFNAWIFLVSAVGLKVKKKCYFGGKSYVHTKWMIHLDNEGKL